MIRIRAILILAAVTAATTARAEVPAPADLAVDIIVSGRTSTAREVKVAKTGDEIPKTFSGDKVKNTPGFSWYVSRHYALKTDYKEEKARFYLALLEMAYPHYVELFGREIPGIRETRMATCYASSEKQLRKAMESDGANWSFDGGGITLEGYRCAYEYPSGTLDYHQRYILLHEGAHLYQMCLNGTDETAPKWYVEGVADLLSSHVYDTAQRRLTVHVFDKPTTHDYFDEGLIEYRKRPLSAKQVSDKGEVPRGIGFLFVHFLSDDPDRLQKFRLWRDEMFRLNKTKYQGDAGRLMQELFGPWDALSAAFKAWVEPRRNTFHYAEWGWEQEADTLWSYGFAKEGKLSETDVYLVPGGRPAYDPLRMDYPMQPASPLVGPVERGAAEPSIGCLLDFSHNPRRGVTGLGLGLIAKDAATEKKAAPPVAPAAGQAKESAKPPGDEGSPAPSGPPGYLRVLVEASARLVLDGKEIGMAETSVPLPQDLREAMAAGGHRIGMTVRIAKDWIEVTLRANDPAAERPAELRAALPLTQAERERLLSRPVAILARDGHHGVTPYFDDRRRAEPDLSVPAPPNRWRNPGDRQLAALYRAAWGLKEKTPTSLLDLKAAMLAAADREPPVQKAAVALYEKSLAQALKDISQCGADPGAVAGATEALRAAGLGAGPSPP